LEPVRQEVESVFNFGIQVEFSAEPDGAGTVIRQVAQFEPHGWAGFVYWYLLWPIHAVMFREMLRRIAVAARRAEPARVESYAAPAGK